MKGKLLAFGGVCTAAVAACMLVWFLKVPDLLSEESYNQIRLGMSIEEVVAILGADGGDVAAPINQNRVTVEREVQSMPSEGDWHPRPDEDNKPNRRLVWSGQDAFIMIRFDQDQRVTDRMLLRLKPLSVAQRLRNLAPIP